jgi:HK97 family phage portal protein
MKIFGWKSAGRGLLRPVQSRAWSARAYSIPGSSGEWPRSYEAQVRDGYLNNAIAQRAVRLVAEGAASAPITSPDPALLALVNATSGGQALLETAAVHMLLHGNAYIEILRSGDGAPCELYALRPERMAVEADLRGWPAAYIYKVGDATSRISADDIIHIRSMHPLDDHYGLGCLGAASGAIAAHNAAAKWNKALLDNAARPSGALMYETGEGAGLSNEQFERLKGELADSFQGANNAGRPMLLEGGLKWQAMSLSPAEMDFAGLKSAAAREIALAFGVPPMLLGLPGDATYANYREANKALWRQSILPLVSKILAAIAEGLRPSWPGAVLSVDLDQVGALSEDRERLWAQVSAADFLTADEKRAAIGLAPAAAAPLPTPSNDPHKTGALELKFNPWHDTQDGKFTSAGHGQSYGVGVSSGDASGSHGVPRTKPPAPQKRIQSGGGSFGGGGASGSWDRPEPKKPSPQIRQPKREIVKPQPITARVAVPQRIAKQPGRKISAGGYNFEADTQDRTVRAHGQLRLVPEQPRSRSSQRDAGKPDRLPKDHGGHFIGRQFGGPETRYNHFAQNARFNSSDYKSLENDWKRELKAGRQVRVDIRTLYPRNSKRPERLNVTYYVNGKRLFRSFPNLKQGRIK